MTFQFICVLIIVDTVILWLAIERISEWECESEKYQRLVRENAMLRWKCRDLERTIRRLQNNDTI